MVGRHCVDERKETQVEFTYPDELFCIYVFGCLRRRLEDESHKPKSLETNKNLSPSIVVDPILQPAMHRPVEGLDDQLIQGIEYRVNGSTVGTSANWWSNYDFTLPEDLTGQILLEARVVDVFGWVIATDMVSVNLVSGNVNQSPQNSFAAGAHITTGDTCENPCELRVSTSSSTFSVEYHAGGYYLGSATEYDGYAISYSFHQTGRRHYGKCI